VGRSTSSRIPPIPPFPSRFSLLRWVVKAWLEIESGFVAFFSFRLASLHATLVVCSSAVYFGLAWPLRCISLVLPLEVGLLWLRRLLAFEPLSFLVTGFFYFLPACWISFFWARCPFFFPWIICITAVWLPFCKRFFSLRPPVTVALNDFSPP